MLCKVVFLNSTFVFQAHSWQLCPIAKPEWGQPATWPQWETWDVSVIASLPCLALPFKYCSPVGISSTTLCWQRTAMNRSSHCLPKRKLLNRQTSSIKLRIVIQPQGSAARLMSQRANKGRSMSPGRFRGHTYYHYFLLINITCTQWRKCKRYKKHI